MGLEVSDATAFLLNRPLTAARPEEIIAQAVRHVPRRRLAAVSSFGTESAVLLKYVADIDPTIPVLFLDTGWIFEETLAYRDRLVARLGLTDVRILRPNQDDLALHDPQSDLWQRDVKSCCEVRKVLPLFRALRDFDGWLNGRKRYHGATRAEIPVIEVEGARLKFSPLARMSRHELDEEFARHDLPRHPLEAMGFASVGCLPCTSRTQAGENPRAGRWRGTGRTECGIHDARVA